MRIAFSGTHRTGKTTLIEAVAAGVTGYEVIEEPYRLLEDEGHEFADPPSVDDFEHQLRRSIESVLASPPNALIDRCPLDLVAYLQVARGFDRDAWLDDVRDAMAVLDAVIFVPIEAPDRIAVAAHEDLRWRRAVHAALEALVVDDALGLELEAEHIEIAEVTGDLGARVRQVRRVLRVPGG
jgi:hypothetical protein